MTASLPFCRIVRPAFDRYPFRAKCSRRSLFAEMPRRGRGSRQWDIKESTLSQFPDNEGMSDVNDYLRMRLFLFDGNGEVVSVEDSVGCHLAGAFAWLSSRLHFSRKALTSTSALQVADDNSHSIGPQDLRAAKAHFQATFDASPHDWQSRQDIRMKRRPALDCPRHHTPSAQQRRRRSTYIS